MAMTPYGWVNDPDFGEIQRQKNAANDAEVEKRDRISKYNTWLQDTMAAGPTLGRSYAASIGLNPDTPGMADIINQISSGIGAKAPRDMETGNPEQYWGSDAFQQGFNDFENRGRRANTMQVRNTFAPGFESKLLPDSDIDSIVNEIIGEQRGLANTRLGYQEKRGLLNPQGLEQANKSLTNQESAGRSTLSSLARGQLDKDRSSILDIVSNAGSAASTWMLGNDAFSVDPYQQQVNDRATRERAGFGGDVRAALGNTELFDIPTIVAQAGTAQGSDNLNFGSVPGGQGKKKPASRGLGSSGGGF